MTKDDYLSVKAIFDKMATIMHYSAKTVIELDCNYVETQQELNDAYRWLSAQDVAE